MPQKVLLDLSLESLTGPMSEYGTQEMKKECSSPARRTARSSDGFSSRWPPETNSEKRREVQVSHIRF
jgi:hypothetical protein